MRFDGSAPVEHRILARIEAHPGGCWLWVPDKSFDHITEALTQARIAAQSLSPQPVDEPGDNAVFGG